MTYTFSLNKNSFQKTTYSKTLYAHLNNVFHKQGPISTSNTYNALLKKVITTLQNTQKKKKTSPLFDTEIKETSTHSPLIEVTPWGGVSIKKVDVSKNFIQKLLIVHQYGILGFEIHNKKVEKLNVLEGSCLLISSQHASKNWKKGHVTISLGEKGNKVILQPGDEHGIIALTNCVIEETSTNNLDDLVFIFPSKQIA